ncbi:MAG TPA: SUMF1/EgtB/PvdO family nonheme iron enzyme [Pyrinomonadaceae bacterium]|jgi:formylglycine-generating enzyme required for sulfatase activity|nr:SUMF1/EgtB/PvdO family nonheme iron enzyme [Pyrinomonadaceae bacterium]
MRQSAKQSARIFICYRRADSAGHAIHLRCHLLKQFKGGQVFMDTDIEPGDQFVRKIDREAGACEILIALIGKHWLTIGDDAGRRRLDEPGDILCREIAIALDRGIIVIPVLVDGARMPPQRDLPKTIEGLSNHQHFELSNQHWDSNARRLITHIEGKLAEHRKARQREERQREKETGGVAAHPAHRQRAEWALVVVNLALFLGLLIWFFARALPVKKTWIDIVEISAGQCKVGSTDGHDNEVPVRQVKFTESFFIGKYEVTQRQWKDLMGEDNNPSLNKGNDLPVENITWDQAREFIDKLNEMQNDYRYSFPTEAEWECACRMGDAEKDYVDILKQRAWYGDTNAPQHTHAPMSASAEGKKSDESGLYYMHGNVWEWCWDAYSENYNTLPENGSAWGGEGENPPRVLRGGAFNSSADSCRCSFRKGEAGDTTGGSFGLRVVARPRFTNPTWPGFGI